MTAPHLQSINIRPGVNVLTVLRHLNYKPWFALAEFVDNSLGSFLRLRDEIEVIEGMKPTLKVTITISPTDNRIVIRDNAGGIRQEEFPRAFRAAEVPPDRTGLSEFGMGMKSAACWFAPTWSARTSALGEAVERKVSFDIAAIVRDALEELQIKEVPADRRHHFTEIVLSEVFKIPAGRTLGKIKDHLADIYRIFIRQGTLELWVNDEQLTHTPPDILAAPAVRGDDPTPVQWLKEFAIDWPDERQIYGFAAIRRTASTSQAGFALFRRNRLIQGSADEGYRPEEIFGKSNSFVYQRLFGELHLKGFGVSHTKDGIQWDGLEEEFLMRLRGVLDEEPLPLLRQAREYRIKPRPEELESAAVEAVERTVTLLARDLPKSIADIAPVPISFDAPPEFSPAAAPLAVKELEIQHESVSWRIRLETTSDPGVADWIETFDRRSEPDGVQYVGVRLSLVHPFTQRFSSADPDEIELLLRIAAALAVAEALARMGGAKQVGIVRKNFNELLRDAFSR
jgi:hypothetical protein